MIETRIHLIVRDACATLVRTVEAAIDTGSIHNARSALIEGRRTQVIRSLLEDETGGPDHDEGVSLSSAASR